jgi:hypothetical protein
MADGDGSGWMERRASRAPIVIGKMKLLCRLSLSSFYVEGRDYAFITSTGVEPIPPNVLSFHEEKFYSTKNVP